MAKTKVAAEESAANEDVRYDVTLNGRFEYLGFLYLPGPQHEVDQTIKEAMEAEGKIETCRAITLS